MLHSDPPCGRNIRESLFFRWNGDSNLIYGRELTYLEFVDIDSFSEACCGNWNRHWSIHTNEEEETHPNDYQFFFWLGAKAMMMCWGLLEN